MPDSDGVLEAERLGLEVERLKRDMEAAKAAGAGDVNRLKVRLQELEARRSAAIARRLDETHAATD